jgi:hypothetical protein
MDHFHYSLGLLEIDRLRLNIQDNLLTSDYAHDFDHFDVLAPMFLCKHNDFPLDNTAERPYPQMMLSQEIHAISIGPTGSSVC